MRKAILTSLIFWLLSLMIFSQEANPKSVVFLKNGESLKGQVLMKTSEVLVLQTDDGGRYQFQLSEIDKIEQGRKSIEKESTGEISNFAGIIELNGGLAYASLEGAQFSPLISGTVALGSRDFLKSTFFAGIGTGMEAVFSKEDNENLLLVPLFIRLNKTFTDNSIKPYFGTDAGYAFCLNKEYKGGVLFKLTGGANFSVSRKLSFNVGVFGKIQQISGTVIEKNEWGEFLKQGTTPLYSTGLSFAFLF